MYSFLNGKTSLISNSTVGSPSYFSCFKLSDGSLTNAQIIDTAGQEKYKSLNEQYYKKADGCLLVYDIANRESFEECKNYYIKNIIERCKKNAKIILLGNKTDLEDQRVVSSEEGANLALKNDYIFLETSCLKNTNVSNAFETLIEMTNIEIKASKKEPSIILKKKKRKKSKKECC